MLKTLIQSPDWMLRHADTAGVLLRRPEKQHSSMKPTLASFAILQAKPADPFLSPTRQADLYAAQATLLSLSGQMDMAEERLQQGLNVCPKHPLLNHNLGNQLMQKGENRAAYEHFNRALATNPRLGGSAMNAGVCLMKLQDFSGAEKMFRRTCQLQPENYQSWANHSLALQQLGEYRKALMSLEEAARLNPSNLQLKKALTGLRQKL